jgi:hypothetical protein
MRTFFQVAIHSTNMKYEIGKLEGITHEGIITMQFPIALPSFLRSLYIKISTNTILSYFGNKL